MEYSLNDNELFLYTNRPEVLLLLPEVKPRSVSSVKGFSLTGINQTSIGNSKTNP